EVHHVTSCPLSRRACASKPVRRNLTDSLSNGNVSHVFTSQIRNRLTFFLRFRPQSYERSSTGVRRHRTPYHTMALSRTSQVTTVRETIGQLHPIRTCCFRPPTGHPSRPIARPLVRITLTWSLSSVLKRTKTRSEDDRAEINCEGRRSRRIRP